MVQHDTNHPSFHDLEILAEASQLLTVVDLDRVIYEVIGLASRAVGAQNISLFLLEKEQVNWEHLITVRNLSPAQKIKVVGRVLEEGFAGWVLHHKKGAIIEDTKEDNRWVVFPDDTTLTGSAMCVPLLYQDSVIATITLTHAEAHHFRSYHLRLVEIIANQASVAIRNAQSLNELREQSRQLQIIFQAITDVLLVLDSKDGKIMMLNDAALPLLNVYTQTEAIGQALEEFLMVDDVFEPIVEILKSGIGDTQQWSFETHSERSQADYRVRMSVWIGSNRTIGYVVVMHNITEIHDLARFKDEMLRVASHDLRSPLALVAGYADMVSMDTPDPESPVHEYIEVIKGQTEKMGNLVDDLLRVERIRQSPLELHEKIDIAALIKLVIVNTRPIAKAKSIQFESQIKLEGIPRIIADPVLIRQAMENFINNAIKYTPEAGKVTIMAYYDDRRFYFVVEDTGMGIPEEHQPYVFESFYRVNSIKNKEKGSGLGLSLVKTVIDRHYGEVWLKSVEDQGSRFGFWLPIDRTLDTQEVEVVLMPDDE
jgi:signal transduction histidine kinase